MDIRGSKSSGASKGHTPVEAENTLQTTATGTVVHLLGAGEWLGIVDQVDGGTGEKSIFLDGTPMENADGSKNFQGVSWEFRPGTLDQEPFSGVDGVETPSGQFRIQVKQALPITRVVTTAPLVDGIRVSIYVPALYTQEDDGDLVGASVSFRIEHKSNLDAAWTVYGGGDITIKDKCTSPAVLDYILPVTRPQIEDGEIYSVQVRVTRTTADSDSSKLANAIYWNSFASIISEKLRYARSAMLKLSAAAEQFGSTIPPTAVECYCLKVPVPTGYNPATRTYPDFWDGTFQADKQWSDNPAWCLYDALTDPIDGLGEPGEEPAVDKWEIYRIARWCDELVPDGQGGQEPRHLFNYAFTTREDAYKSLQAMVSNFRAMLWLSGDGLVPSADMPADPKTPVAPANVIGGRFTYSGVDVRTIASVVIATYNDPADGYRTTQHVEEDVELIAKYGWVPMDLTVVGDVRLSAVIRACKWVLDGQKHPQESVSYQASQDHADVAPGQIIAIADPKRIGARRGGRISAASTGSVTLDAPVTLAAGETYQVSVVTPAGALVARDVSSPAGTHSTLALAEPLAAEDIPLVGALWLLSGTDAEPRQYRVMSVSESESGVYEIAAINHDPDKWARIEQGLTLPERTYSTIPTGPVAAPTAITATEFQVGTGSGYLPGLTIGWTRSPDVRASYYRVQMRRPGLSTWETVADQTQDASVDIRSGLSVNGPYAFRVFALDGFGGMTSQPAYLDGVHVQGKVAPPSDVLAVRSEITRAGVILSWAAVGDIDAHDYEVRAGADWLSGETLWRGAATSTPPLPIFSPGQHVLQVKVYDAHGNESATPASVVVTIAAPSVPTLAYALVGQAVRLTVAPSAGSYPVEATTIASGGQAWTVAAGALDLPVDWTGPRVFEARSRDIHGNLGPAASVTVAIAAVAAPVSISTVGLTRSIKAVIGYALSPNLAAVEVWASATNNRADAVRVGDTTSGELVLSGLDLIDTRYFWARCRDKWGQTTDWYPADAHAGVEGQTSTDPTTILDLLAGQLGEDQLAQDLSERLDMLDRVGLGTTPDVFSPGTLLTLPQLAIENAINLSKHSDDLRGLLTVAGEQAAALRALDDKLALVSSMDWSASASYAVDQEAKSGGAVWVCIAQVGPTSTPPESDPDHWRQAESLITLYGQVQQAVDELAASVATVVTQINFDALANRVTVAESALEQQAAEISLRVEQSDFDSFADNVVPRYDANRTYSKNQFVRSGVQTYKALQDISFTPAPPVTNSAYWVVVPDLSRSLTTSITGIDVLAGQIDIHASAITGPICFTDGVAEDGVAVRGVEDIIGLDARMTKAFINVDGLRGIIELQASSIDGLTATAKEADIRLDGVEGAITLSATKQELGVVDGRVSQALVSINTLEGVTDTLGSEIESITTITDAQQEEIADARVAIQSLQTEDGRLQSQITSAARAIVGTMAMDDSASDGSAAVKTVEDVVELDNRLTVNSISMAQAYQTIGVLQESDNSIRAEILSMTELLDSQGQAVAQAYEQITALSTADGEIRTSLDEVARIVASNGEAIAGAEQTLTAWSDPLGNPMAEWSVKLDVKGHVAGVGLATNEELSSFIVRADKFLVSLPGTDITRPIFYAGALPGGGQGVAINGDIIARGSVAAEALAVAFLSAISASLGDIESGRIKTGDLEVVEGGRVVVGLDNVILDSNGNRMLVCPDGGEIAGNDVVRMDSAGLQVSYWDALYELRREYKPIVRSEQGTANSGDTVYLPGIWRETPRVQVSMNTLLGYNPAYANQSQTWNVRAENLREYNPATDGDQAGTGYWKFQAIARLELGGANGTNAVNSSTAGSSDTWTAAEFATPENCSSITLSVNLSSVRGTGTAPNYYYRNVSWRVGYASTSGGAITWTSSRTKGVGATLGQVSDAMTVTFPSGGKWYCRVEFTAGDAGGTFTSGSGGYEYGADVVVTNSGRQNVGGISYPSSVTLTLPTPSLPGGYELYAVDYSYNYAFSIPDGSGLKITHTYGTLYKSSSGNSYGLGSEVALSASGTDSSFTASKIKMTITSPNGTVSYVGAIWNARAACKIRKQIANSAVAQNAFTVSSYTYVLATATVLAQGTCNYIATGR